MKKRALTVVILIFILSSCGQAKSIEDGQTSTISSTVKIEDFTSEEQELQDDNVTSLSTDTKPAESIEEEKPLFQSNANDELENEVQEIQNDNVASPSTDTKPAESIEEEKPLFQSNANDDRLENLIGEYDYLSDYGIGKLIITKTSYGYDISDYESESSYRFLADSSNIDAIENNRIYIKYPEQVFSDDTVIFSYYILEYGTNEINVYYTKDIHEEEQFLYCATKKNVDDANSEVGIQNPNKNI